MRKRTGICVLFLLICCAGCIFYMVQKEKNKDSISLPYQNALITEQTADIDGDGFEETIYLYGKTEDGVHFEKLNVTLKTTASGLLKKTNTDHLSGTEPTMQIADFTGDGIKDVLVRAQNESGAAIGIFNFAPQIPLNIFPEKGGMKMELAFTDRFSLSATMHGSIFSISLEQIKNTLIEQGVYQADGKRIANPAVTLLGYSNVFCENGTVFGVQPVVFGEEQTPLCYILPKLQFAQNTWQITDWEVSFTPPPLP